MRTRRAFIVNLCEDVSVVVAKHQSVTLMTNTIMPNGLVCIKTMAQVHHSKGQDTTDDFYLVVSWNDLEPEPQSTPGTSRRKAGGAQSENERKLA